MDADKIKNKNRQEIDRIYRINNTKPEYPLLPELTIGHIFFLRIVRLGVGVVRASA